MKQPHFLHVDTNSQKLKVHYKLFSQLWSKVDVAVSQKWANVIIFCMLVQIQAN